jgi:hypothetical protein
LHQQNISKIPFLDFEIIFLNNGKVFDQSLVLIYEIKNKQEILCTTEARSTFFGCMGSNPKFLGFFHLQYEISVRQIKIMLYVKNLRLLPDAG